jgi:HlyD family secretion protein
MKKNNLFKYLLIAVIVLIVFAITGKKMGWIGQRESVSVTVEKAQARTITESVAANGKVQPEIEVKISPDVSGEVVEMYVKEGDEVKMGQLLAKINPNIYVSAVDRMVAALNTAKANIANARARLAQSESQLAKAESSYKRNKKLADDGAISPSDFEAAKSAYEVARAEVDAARENVSASEFSLKSSEASLKEARDNLLKTSIIAPVNGTISKLSVEKGERVVGTSQMAGTEMMRIANLNEMEVSVEVNENDIVRVHLNDTTIIDVDSYIDRKFRGVVTEIGNSANTIGASTDQVTNFSVKIRILRDSYLDLIPADRPNQSPFRPGMSATVEIQTRRASNILTVPIQAVTTRDTAAKKMKEEMDGPREEGSSGQKKEEKNRKDEKIIECVFIYKDGKVKMQPVTIGIQDNMYIEIKTGLSSADEVVTGPYSAVAKRLKNGDPVKVVTKEQLFNMKEKE